MYLYMDIALNFSCEACAKCCRNDWQVTVNEKSYRRNAELFLNIGKQAEFQLAFIPIQGQKELGEYAYIAKKANGECWFLATDNLCKLQKQAGHDHLDAVCQTFPRCPMNTARGIELTLSFSCPAVLKRVNRCEPLTVIRSEYPPISFIPDTYIANVFPNQQPISSPLRYYFELEQHFMDILQCRGMTIFERITLIRKTISAITELTSDNDFNGNLTSLLYHNYDLLDAAALPAPSEYYTADILLEHFLVNLVFKKFFYVYSLQRGLLLLEHIWHYIDNVRSQATDILTDIELTRSAILAVEFQYGHNRRALLEQAKLIAATEASAVIPTGITAD